MRILPVGRRWDTPREKAPNAFAGKEGPYGHGRVKNRVNPPYEAAWQPPLRAMHIVYPGFLERVSHVSFISGVSTFSAQSCNVTSSNATDTNASPSCKTSVTSFAMASASRVFCCAVLP